MRKTIALFMIVATLSTFIGLAAADDDHRPWRRGSEVAPVTDPVYLRECGDCHLAYPPGLLPARSWQAIMNGLEDHFGDNAALDATTQGQLLDYLTRNSADHADYPRSRKIARQLTAGDTLLRISELPFFRSEHDELTPAMVRDNPEVGSFSRCNACHRRAEQGSFREHEIDIPGYGRWED
ncbi:MAG: diheme cytochrome c [Gammaproteobacteria bacterium]|nr:diheme cytochrome c [Gammaproteobacteria bacterium]